MAPTAPAPRSGGTLVFAIDTDPDRLDPNLTNLRTAEIVMYQIYDTLIVRDPKDKNFKPWLATSWEVSPDGRSYTFRLRRDVRFHDGTPFNAAAVKFNMDRTHDPALATRCAGCAVGFYQSSDVIDPFSVRINLRTPWAPFLDAMSLWYRIASPAAVQQAGDQNYGRRPVGTGPYRFVEWIPNNRIVLERNPDYNWAGPIFDHSGPGYLERIIFRVIPEGSTRLAALETGEVQIAILLPAPDFQRLARDARFQPIIGLAPGVPFTLAINTTKFPTNELAVRRALNFGINREIIARAVFGAYQPFGAFRPAYTILSPVTFGYDKASEVYQYDPERAQELLEAAGWKPGSDRIREKGGRKLEVVLASWEQGAPEVMQSHLRRIGVSLRLLITDTVAVNEAQRKQESHMSPVPAARTDPDILSALLHSRNVGVGFNFAFIKDPELDRLLDQSASEVNIDRRRQLYARISRLVMERAYMLPIHTRDNAALALITVQGVKFDVTGTFPWLYDAWLRQ
jgi:peptide/nickel transport system substrate-binding protein